MTISPSMFILSSSFAHQILINKIIYCFFYPSKVDPTQEQDDNWLFGKIGSDKQGFFPIAYAERIIP